jgi:predicted lipid-binding transport protein (Tim44 family)
MKRLLMTMMVALAALSVTVTEVEAKRMGGGGSIGRQSSQSGMSRQAAPPAQSNQVAPANRQSPAATPQATPPKPASPWRNILGGALLGLGLGALLSHFGLGGAMANIIGMLLMAALVIGAVVLLMRLFRGKNKQGQPAFAGAYGNTRNEPGSNAFEQSATPEIGSRLEPHAAPAAYQGTSVSGNSIPGAAAGTAAAGAGAAGLAGGAAVEEVAAATLPPDFDAAAFLRHAKTYFIRLQAAWDKADINDIREFTSPEMFGELRLQLQERGASANHTDVVSLNADLLGIETGANDYLASVRFNGMIRESENAPAEPFTEIWNLSKPLSGQGGWVLAGIQQVN